MSFAEGKEYQIYDNSPNKHSVIDERDGLARYKKDSNKG